MDKILESLGKKPFSKLNINQKSTIDPKKSVRKPSVLSPKPEIRTNLRNLSMAAQTMPNGFLSPNEKLSKLANQSAAGQIAFGKRSASVKQPVNLSAKLDGKSGKFASK